MLDLSMRRDLSEARKRVRRAHHAVLEEAACAWQDYLYEYDGSWSRLRRRDVERFFAVWVVRRYAGAGAVAVRGLLAAAILLVRLRRRPLRRSKNSLWHRASRVARRTWAAVKASELLSLSRSAEVSRLTHLPHGSCLDEVGPPDGDDFAGDWSRLELSAPEDYWEVVLCADKNLVLRSLHEKKIVGPVTLPQEFVQALVPGVILNLQLGRSEDSYVVRQHGFCYPAAAADTLLQETEVVAGMQ